jgi:hypothetical protein
MRLNKKKKDFIFTFVAYLIGYNFFYVLAAVVDYCTFSILLYEPKREYILQYTEQNSQHMKHQIYYYVFTFF